MGNKIIEHTVLQGDKHEVKFEMRLGHDTLSLVVEIDRYDDDDSHMAFKKLHELAERTLNLAPIDIP